MSDLFNEVEMPLLPVLARMELAGVTIDRDQLAAMSVEFGATLADLETRIYGLVGHEFNIGSPKQLEQVLLRRARPAGHEAHADRLTRRMHRSWRSCATSTR